MSDTLGIAVLRKSASLVRIRRTGKAVSIVSRLSIARPPGKKPSEIVPELLARVGPADPRLRVAVVLSMSDLACGEAWEVPQGVRGKELARAAPSLVEARSASETLETLAVDSRISGREIRAVAMGREELERLSDVLAGYSPVQITAAPLALASVFGAASFTSGGETFSVGKGEEGWKIRSFPSEAPDEAGSLLWNGIPVPSQDAAAFAAALADPEELPNLLSTLPQFRKTFAGTFRDPLLGIAAAATLCLGALGVHFHREVAREREEKAAARRAERELWTRYLPREEPREGRLLRRMRERLEDLGEGAGAAEFPSALAFWGEIAGRMPDPEALGLTLESLDLAPDGGRLSARLPAQKDDPLKNASSLEASLSQSAKLAARGDYEVRDGQVHVRLRMDYKP